MSKLAEYMLVLSEDGAEHDSFRRDKTAAMTRFGLSDAEQHLVLAGSPAAIRAEIHGEEPKPRPKPVPIVGTPDPKPE